MKVKSMENTLNGKGSAVQIPKIIFDPHTTPKAESATFNSYGLDLTNPDFLKYKKDNLEAEIIGGINTQVLTRFNILLKISKRPQQSASDVYRNNVDLYNENNVQHFIKQSQIKLKTDVTRITDFIYDLIERLESYRKDKCTYIEDKIVIESPQPKVVKQVDKILYSDTVLKDIQELFTKSGVVISRTGLQLFLIALSSKLPNVMHCVLQGSPELTSVLIKDFASTLPFEVNRYKTSISDNVLYYAPSKNYWNHKVLLLPTIDKLGKKNIALTELISQGHVNRLVTENTELGSYRASNKSVHGNLSFISSTNTGYNELLRSDKVVVLPLINTKVIKETMATNEIMKHAGLIDVSLVDDATKLLQFIFREIKAVKVINPYLEQLNVARYFDEDYRQIKQFLQLTNLMTMLHQKQLGIAKDGNVIQVEVQAKHMLLTLELFRELWINDEKELSFNVSRTLSRIKAAIKNEYPEDCMDTEFKVKAMRATLKVNPSSFARHINTLYDYGKIERTGGNRRDGFTYKVISWNGSTSAERFEQFKQEVSQL